MPGLGARAPDHFVGNAASLELGTGFLTGSLKQLVQMKALSTADH